MDSINLAYIAPKVAKVWHIDFIEKHCKIKRTVTFERFAE